MSEGGSGKRRGLGFLVLIGVAAAVAIAIAGDDELRAGLKAKLQLDGRGRRR